MEEKINWQYVANSKSYPLIKSMHYLVKGYIIVEGRQVRTLRLVISFDGAKFIPSCDDMVIDMYAKLII